jgi:hypothetical protein
MIICLSAALARDEFGERMKKLVDIGGLGSCPLLGDFGNLRWGVIVQHDAPFLDGQNPSVELAALVGALRNGGNSSTLWRNNARSSDRE